VILDRATSSAQVGVESIIGDASDIPEEHHKLMESHLQAAWNYRPQVYRGRVTLFRTRTLSLSRSHDPEMGWGELATGGVEIKMIPGAHYNLLEKPHVEALAAQLKSSLAQAHTVGQGRSGADLTGEDKS
jgi:thioesterase domain-containing protein